MSDPFPSADDFEQAALSCDGDFCAEGTEQLLRDAARVRRAYDAKVADFDAVCEERNIAEAKLATVIAEYKADYAEGLITGRALEKKKQSARSDGATRTVIDLRHQLAAVTDERDTLLVTSCGTRMRARSLQRALDAQQAIIQQLHGYVQHKSECALAMAPYGSEARRMLSMQGRKYVCTCGLDVALKGSSDATR